MKGVIRFYDILKNSHITLDVENGIAVNPHSGLVRLYPYYDALVVAVVASVPQADGCCQEIRVQIAAPSEVEVEIVLVVISVTDERVSSAVVVVLTAHDDGMTYVQFFLEQAYPYGVRIFKIIVIVHIIVSDQPDCRGVVEICDQRFLGAVVESGAAIR